MAAMFVNGSKRNEQFYSGPSIDATYQVSVHLAEEKIFLEIFRPDPLTNTAGTGNSCF
jgi:hypothetical protein